MDQAPTPPPLAEWAVDSPSRDLPLAAHREAAERRAAHLKIAVTIALIILGAAIGIGTLIGDSKAKQENEKNLNALREEHLRQLTGTPNRP